MSLLSEFVSGSGFGWISGGSGGLLISAALEGSTLMFGLGMLDISFGIPGKSGRLVLVDNFRVLHQMIRQINRLALLGY